MKNPLKIKTASEAVLTNLDFMLIDSAKVFVPSFVFDHVIYWTIDFYIVPHSFALNLE